MSLSAKSTKTKGSKNYYYIVAGLPDISIEDTKLSFTRKDFLEEISEQMLPEEYALLELLMLPFDNRNLFNMLTKNGKPFIEGGKYTADELEAEIKTAGSLEEYMGQFIEEFKEANDNKTLHELENRLTELYFEYVTGTPNRFIKEYFRFEQGLRNIIAGFNCRRHDLPIEGEVIGDDDIAEAVKKSNARDFSLSKEISYIEPLLNTYENSDLIERESFIDTIRWNYLSENEYFHYFTVERIFSFIVKLGIVERWVGLNKEKGEQLFRQFVSELSESYEFGKEFSINEGKK